MPDFCSYWTEKGEVECHTRGSVSSKDPMVSRKTPMASYGEYISDNSLFWVLPALSTVAIEGNTQKILEGSRSLLFSLIFLQFTKSSSSLKCYLIRYFLF